MAFARGRATDLVGPQFDAQPIDQPRHLRFPPGLADQRLLTGIERFPPACLERKGVEAEFRVERRRMVGEQALQMGRLAAWNGGGHARQRDASVDPIARQCEPPHSQTAGLQLGDQNRNQQVERLRGRLGMGHRFLQPQQRARWQVERCRGQRFGFAPKCAIERVERMIALAKSPRQSLARNSGKITDGLEPEPDQGPGLARSKPKRGNGEWGKTPGQPPSSQCRWTDCRLPTAIAGQPPSRSGSGCDRKRAGIADPGQPRPDVHGQRSLAAEQMRNPGHVQAQ